MRFPVLLAAFLLTVLSACEPSAPPADPAPSATAEPTATPPAEMSHGEAPVGTVLVPEEAPDAPPRSTSRRHQVRMTTSHVRHEVTPGVFYDGWTFDSIIPGPVVRVTVGDTVDFTLVNVSTMPHSMDFHAAEIAPDRAYRNVMPGDSISFQFVARVPGAFMYHCGTAPVAAHIANGMYGALIVDPRTPRPAAREFVLVQSEFYMGAPAGPDSLRSMAWDKVLNAAPDHVVFNGIGSRYATHPVQVDVGAPLRVFVVNAGPNRVSAFHVVGAIFDRIYADGFGNPLQGVQTWNVPVGGGAVFDFRLVEEGLYPFVSHAFADATKGAVGIFRAGSAAGTMAH